VCGPTVVPPQGDLSAGPFASRSESAGAVVDRPRTGSQSWFGAVGNRDCL